MNKLIHALSAVASISMFSSVAYGFDLTGCDYVGTGNQTGEEIVTAINQADGSDGEKKICIMPRARITSPVNLYGLDYASLSFTGTISIRGVGTGRSRTTVSDLSGYPFINGGSSVGTLLVENINYTGWDFLNATGNVVLRNIYINVPASEPPANPYSHNIMGSCGFLTSAGLEKTFELSNVVVIDPAGKSGPTLINQFAHVRLDGLRVFTANKYAGAFTVLDSADVQLQNIFFEDNSPQNLTPLDASVIDVTRSSGVVLRNVDIGGTNRRKYPLGFRSSQADLLENVNVIAKYFALMVGSSHITQINNAHLDTRDVEGWSGIGAIGIGMYGVNMAYGYVASRIDHINNSVLRAFGSANSQAPYYRFGAITAHLVSVDGQVITLGTVGAVENTASFSMV